MLDKQHSFPLRIHTRLSRWRMTRLKMCWPGGWCLNRVLSYLCFYVEQGKGNSSARVHLTFPNIVSLLLNSAGNDFIFFPSPYVVINQYFHVSLSPQIEWDQTVASPPAVGVSTSPLLRRPLSGPNWYLRRALYSIPYFTDDLNVCRDRHIFKSHSTIRALYSLHSYSILRYCTAKPSCFSIIIAVDR